MKVSARSSTASGNGINGKGVTVGETVGDTDQVAVIVRVGDMVPDAVKVGEIELVGEMVPVRVTVIVGVNVFVYVGDAYPKVIWSTYPESLPYEALAFFIYDHLKVCVPAPTVKDSKDHVPYNPEIFAWYSPSI
jgi:hypothetical protein